MIKKISVALAGTMMILSAPVFAAAAESLSGGGYTASGQIKDVGFVCEIYDATIGLPTSDGNYIM